MDLPNACRVFVDGTSCVAGFQGLGGSFVLTTGKKLDR